MAGYSRRLASLALGALLAGLLLGCGSDSDGSEPIARDGSTSASSDSGSPSPSEASPSDTSSALPDWPACAQVWVEGENLPKPYDGCLDGDQAVAAQARKCSAGVQLVSYAGRFWGVPGHRISKADGALRSDAEFQRTLATCQA